MKGNICLRTLFSVSNLVSEIQMAEANSESSTAINGLPTNPKLFIINPANQITSTKLNDDNYLLWNLQILASIRGLGLDIYPWRSTSALTTCNYSHRRRNHKSPVSFMVSTRSTSFFFSASLYDWKCLGPNNRMRDLLSVMDASYTFVCFSIQSKCDAL